MIDQPHAFPVLTTERLILRTPASGDAKRIVAYLTRNREHLAPWDPVRSPGYYTLDYWGRELDALGGEIRRGAVLPFLILDRKEPEGEILGRCTLSGMIRGAFQAAFLGYSLDAGAEGKGIMSEALGAVIRHAFEEMNLHRIMANHMPVNVRSARLLRRLGFVPEGYARDYLRIGGRWEDHVLTALVNPGWRAPEA